jgi:hypothetical protein
MVWDIEIKDHWLARNARLRPEANISQQYTAAHVLRSHISVIFFGGFNWKLPNSACVELYW